MIMTWILQLKELDILETNIKEKWRIIINEKITKIPRRAFNNCPYLTTVELPETITSDEAFANCYHLIEITIPL